MLNMDDFDTAQEIRKRRKQIDEIVAEQLVSSTLHPMAFWHRSVI